MMKKILSGLTLITLLSGTTLLGKTVLSGEKVVTVFKSGDSVFCRGLHYEKDEFEISKQTHNEVMSSGTTLLVTSKQGIPKVIPLGDFECYKKD